MLKKTLVLILSRFVNYTRHHPETCLMYIWKITTLNGFTELFAFLPGPDLDMWRPWAVVPVEPPPSTLEY